MLNVQYRCTSPKSKLSDMVNSIVDQPQRIFLSMFRYKDESELSEQLVYDMLKLGPGPLVDHPDILSKDPVIEGKVKLIINDPEIHKHSISSLSLENPTWTDILQEANYMLARCDTPIGFLEKIVPLDAGTYELVFAH
jgi:hypothetical protein